jgi:hypothetical protein
MGFSAHSECRRAPLPPCGVETSEARLWVGGGGQRVLNLAQHPVKISKHFMIPEPQHAVATGFDPPCARIICSTLRVMLSAIQFNDELGPAADEINDKRSNHCLTPEM